MSIFAELSQKALADQYFKDLFYKAELRAAANFFPAGKPEFTEKDLTDILRFSDILSRSAEPEAQNKAYKVISLLVDDYKGEALFRTFANSVLTKLGNFPAISYIDKYKEDDDEQSLELIFEKIVKESYQSIPGSDKIFTDAQYELFESLKNSNHYSFSGPTSLGKSFILNAFIRTLIVEDKINDNIVILVPTRALINQTLINLKKEYEDVDDYRILSHPTVPETFKRSGGKYIFVFTPERLIAYLSDINNPKIGYLFIDEAQKVIADNDTRSPLYYHAILQAERKSVKLYFASPNIPNPEVFLRLFEKSTDESLNIKSSPVAQNRYFLDLLENRCVLFSDVAGEQELALDHNDTDFWTWLIRLSGEDASIVYCNTKADTIDYALEFARGLPEKNDERIDEVISVIKEHLHEKYYLIDCLKKGVAFHFGNLPQRIRVKIEDLFTHKIIDYVFCTSTLLEGVNLPAKNIFILNNAIGLTKFSDIDFWNLAGRAGRLTKELSGNIICTRIEDKRNRWQNPEKDLDVVKNKDIKPVKPKLTEGHINFFKNVEASLTGSEFSKKNATANEVNTWNHYANIALIHEIRSEDSVLHSNFLSKNENARKALADARNANFVPERILSSYSMIKAKYQNYIYRDEELIYKSLGSDVSYETALMTLEMLCDFYRWDVEEAIGRDPMYKSREGLKYYAVLMSAWMESTPLSRMIASSIDYHNRKGEIWDVDQLVFFNPNSKRHINIVVNNIISDIDNILRFRLKNYFSNYYDLLVEKIGKENAGRNWGEYLEYGTTDYRVIELQNIGIPRHLANYLLGKYPEFFVFENDLLVSVSRKELLESMNSKSVEYKELLEVI